VNEYHKYQLSVEVLFTVAALSLAGGEVSGEIPFLGLNLSAGGISNTISPYDALMAVAISLAIYSFLSLLKKEHEKTY